MLDFEIKDATFVGYCRSPQNAQVPDKDFNILLLISLLLTEKLQQNGITCFSLFCKEHFAINSPGIWTHPNSSNNGRKPACPNMHGVERRALERGGGCSRNSQPNQANTGSLLSFTESRLLSSSMAVGQTATQYALHIIRIVCNRPVSYSQLPLIIMTVDSFLQ